MFYDFLTWLFVGVVILFVPAMLILTILLLRKRIKSEKKAVAEGKLFPARSGIQITGFILGIVTLLFAWVGVSTLTGLFGLIFSIFAMKRTNLHGLAIAGLVTSIIGLIISTFFGFVILPALIG